MKTVKTSRIVLSMVLLIALAITSIVLADNVQNDVVAGGNDTFTAGGSTTVNYRITANNGDGQTGCNAADASPATVTVNVPVGVTATPGALTFTSCGIDKPVTFSSATVGDYNITVSVSDGGAGTYNINPAKFTLHVLASPNTAPTVSLNGVTNGATYELGSVRDATCNVTDAEDGNSSFAATLSSVSGPLSAFGLGQQAASCAYTDGGGLTASASATYNIVDTTVPVITFASRTAATIHGWNNSAVTVTWTCSDSGSGVVVASISQTVTAEGANQSATGTCTDNAGNSVSDTQNGINIDLTAPTTSASAAPAPNANGWNNTDVTVSFSGVDALSGIDVCSASALLNSDGAGQSASGTCFDKAGNQSSPATASGINIDKTAPTITGTPDRAPNGLGWYNADVTVTFTCSDATSGVATCSTPVTLGEGADQTVSGTATDLAGNSASATVSGINIDKTAPTISGAVDRASNANGWYNASVMVSFTCSDALSGVATCEPPATLNSEGANQNATGTATDQAGNSASTTIGGINIDLTAPTLTWNGGPADGSSHYYGSVPAAPTCTAVDGLSGPGSCVVTGYSTTVGSHALTATAYDLAGNKYEAQRTYTVLAWTLNGFFQPVDMGGAFNKVKNGSTVPLKFEIFAGSTELTDVSAVKSLTYAQVMCDATAPEGEIETVSTGNTSLRYDLTGGQFIYNWKVSGTTGACYRVTMITQDGSKLQAFFKLK